MLGAVRQKRLTFRGGLELNTKKQIFVGSGGESLSKYKIFQKHAQGTAYESSKKETNYEKIFDYKMI